MPEDVVRTIFRALLNPDNRCEGWLVLKADKAVGFAHLATLHSTNEAGPILYMEDLLVTKACRGQGIATRLIDYLIAYAKERGYARLFWITKADNPARKLYDRYTEGDAWIRYVMRLKKAENAA